jgi:hypothetical protein
VKAVAVMRGLVLGSQVVLGTVDAGRDAGEQAIADLGRSRATSGGAAGRHRRRRRLMPWRADTTRSC